ncbi:hypothetical protein KC341_g90 [Hortaea werneckii]|nr:hypothetical protein KC341_g90 [Hortaea werneckii]
MFLTPFICQKREEKQVLISYTVQQPIPAAGGKPKRRHPMHLSITYSQFPKFPPNPSKPMQNLIRKETS